VLAGRHPERVERLVLVDGGAPIPEYIHAAVEGLIRRLDLTFPSIDSLLAMMRLAPFLQPWNAYLEAHFRSEAEPLPGGIVRIRARRRPLEEDQRLAIEAGLNFDELWVRVRCPTLVLRAKRGFTGGEDWVIRRE